MDGTLGTAKGFPVDVALESLSYHELWSQSAGDAPLMVWYHALNNGFRVPVTGGEDSISSLHRVELVGVSRGYFQLGDQPFTWDELDEGAAGRHAASSPTARCSSSRPTAPAWARRWRCRPAAAASASAAR